MIKEAYFRGLTKVAGDYAWYNPRTWRSYNNPVINFVKPAVNKVYSMTPAGKAQKKILKGIQLTPAQEKAAQEAGSWGNAITTGLAAGNPVTLALTHAQEAGKDIAEEVHTLTGGARADAELQANTPLSAEAQDYLNRHKHGVSTLGAAKAVFWDAPLQRAYRPLHNAAVVNEFTKAMKVAQSQEDPVKRQYLIDRAQRMLDRQLLTTHTDFAAWFPYLVNHPINAFKQKFFGPQVPESTKQAYTMYGAVRTPTFNDWNNKGTLEAAQQVKYTLDHIRRLQDEHGPILNVAHVPDYSKFNFPYFATVVSPGKQDLRPYGVPSAQINKYLAEVRDQADKLYANMGTTINEANKQFPWLNLGPTLEIQHMPDNSTPYFKTNPFDVLQQRFGLGPVNEPTRFAANNLLRSALTSGLFYGGNSGRVGTALATWYLNPRNAQYFRRLREGSKNTADYLMKALGITPTTGAK